MGSVRLLCLFYKFDVPIFEVHESVSVLQVNEIANAEGPDSAVAGG